MTDQLLLVADETSSYTAKASGAIDAGAFVRLGGASADVVSAATSSLKFGDIMISEAAINGDMSYIGGLSATAAATGEPVKVYTEGLFIVRAGEAIIAGQRLQKSESTDDFEVYALDTTVAEDAIGRALTAASAADQYIVMLLRI